MRRAWPRWRAEITLLLARKRAAALRAEHAAIGRLLEEFATAAKLPTTITAPRSASVIYRPPLWLGATLTGGAVAAVVALGAWLMRDRPIEFLRQGAPALHEWVGVERDERLGADERALAAVIGGLEELEARFHKFETALNAGERSYYKTEDDDEIRRMLVSYLTFRTALLRTVWHYQRHAELDDERARLRALLLHYTAAAVAYDYAARFVRAFDGRPVAIKKLNEAEPRWDLAAGTYDTIRANLAHVSHRRWLEAGWQNYHATLPRWAAAGLREGE
eukprot:gene14511-19201_t